MPRWNLYTDALGFRFDSPEAVGLIAALGEDAEVEIDDGERWISSKRLGIEIQCTGRDEHVSTIFLFPGGKDGYQAYTGEIFGAEFGSSAAEVRAAHGEPTKSGSHWDRFDSERLALHFRYHPDTGVDQVTLMFPPDAP